MCEYVGKLGLMWAKWVSRFSSVFASGADTLSGTRELFAAECKVFCFFLFFFSPAFFVFASGADTLSGTRELLAAECKVFGNALPSLGREELDEGECEELAYPQEGRLERLVPKLHRAAVGFGDLSRRLHLVVADGAEEGACEQVCGKYATSMRQVWRVASVGVGVGVNKYATSMRQVCDKYATSMRQVCDKYGEWRMWEWEWEWWMGL